MFYEIPLIGFTVLAQMAVGSHITVNAFQLFSKPTDADVKRLDMARFVILVIMAVGFLFSTTHLGSPLRAFNALIRVGEAPLSNEILTGASFLAFAGLYWLLSVTKTGSYGLRRLINIISVIIGVVFMTAMAKVYYITTVPAWDSVFTGLSFGFTVVTLGLFFGYALLHVLKVCNEKSETLITWLGISLIAFHLVSVAMQSLYFANVSTGMNTGLDHLNSLHSFVLGQLVLTVVALAGWLFAFNYVKSQSQKTLFLAVVFIVLFVAELFGRNVFYGMHFTAGLV